VGFSSRAINQIDIRGFIMAVDEVAAENAAKPPLASSYTKKVAAAV